MIYIILLIITAVFILYETAKVYIVHKNKKFKLKKIYWMVTKKNPFKNKPFYSIDQRLYKAKQLTNIRAAGSDENLILTPHIQHSLEQALEFIEDDELVEVTPSSIRLRKK